MYVAVSTERDLPSISGKPAKLFRRRAQSRHPRKRTKTGDMKDVAVGINLDVSMGAVDSAAGVGCGQAVATTAAEDSDRLSAVLLLFASIQSSPAGAVATGNVVLA